MNRTNQDARVITNKFSLVEHELDLLATKIHLKKGTWVFMTHVYTTQELMDSDHFRRIHAICGKIGDDVMHWSSHGKLSEEGMTAYQLERLAVKRKLSALKKQIREREATAADTLLPFFTGFVQTILKALPLIDTLLRIFPVLDGMRNLKLPDLSSAQQKLLP